MKKIILLAAIAAVLLTSTSQAQTIKAQGKTIVLTDKQIKVLRQANIASINSVLNSGINVSYNETADQIIYLLSK